ncbi:MAG: phosphate ABC transporter ATP-binding protein PstB [Spirochaetales bacterium]|nr:phosphate ABC transporter ATP-binding protein PstB [Spirochaetales bacterium]
MDNTLAMQTKQLDFFYGDFQALHEVNLNFIENHVTALIGPSGCGKSTLLRCLNRMNDLIPDTRAVGEVFFRDQNVYSEEVDPVEIRRRVGMVFQKPNPFPKSVFENIAWGAKINGYKGDMDELVETSLKKCALWDEVKDKLRQNALELSGGQQQRLCIARAIAVEPDVVLMDEPTSALDPISTAKIEDLITELKERYTIIIVTHNMQQAGRVSDQTAFFLNGWIIEAGDTKDIFFNPKEERTEAYISGRFG